MADTSGLNDPGPCPRAPTSAVSRVVRALQPARSQSAACSRSGDAAGTPLSPTLIHLHRIFGELYGLGDDRERVGRGRGRRGGAEGSTALSLAKCRGGTAEAVAAVPAALRATNTLGVGGGIRMQSRGWGGIWLFPPPGDLSGPSPRYPRRPLPFPPSAGVSVAGRAAAEGGAGRRPRGGAARPAPRTSPPHRTGRHTGGVGVRRSPDQCGGWPTHIGEASQPNKGTGTLPPACMKCVKSVHAMTFPHRLDSPLGFSPYWCPEVIISPSTFTRTLGACLYAPVRRRVGFGGGGVFLWAGRRGGPTTR